MAEGKDKELTNLNKQLSDSDTSDDEPSLALATQAAYSHTHAQANPTIECRPSCTKTIIMLTKE